MFTAKQVKEAARALGFTVRRTIHDDIRVATVGRGHEAAAGYVDSYIEAAELVRAHYLRALVAAFEARADELRRHAFEHEMSDYWGESGLAYMRELRQRERYVAAYIHAFNAGPFVPTAPTPLASAELARAHKAALASFGA